MAAVKRMTDEIAKDLQEKYATGDYTQAELGELFSFSVPTINKTVKGVVPAKRKYSHKTTRFVERNKAILSDYNSGATTRQLADKYEMTHQNVSLIIKKAGLDPRDRYFEAIGKQREEREARLAAEKKEKAERKMAKVNQISELWKAGATVDEIREAAGLGSVGAAQVKIALLRKKYGVEKFPKRNAFGLSEEERAEAARKRLEKVEELSRLWNSGEATNEEMAAVFGWKPSTVVGRVTSLRKEFGEERFQYRRKPKAETTEAAEEGLEVVDVENLSVE